jgi:acyl carrier protein
MQRQTRGMDQGSLLGLIAASLRLPVAAVGEASTMQNTRRWDSLRHVLLVTRIEAAYGISLTDSELATATSVVSIREILRDHGIAHPGPSTP